ncbi:MAG: FAD-binding oxidoreductase [Pseudomonadota bacterium]
MSQHTVVIGAGIVGVSTAIWLHRAGVSTTLIDRASPGHGTSYGNAGVLAAVSVAPVTAPGLIAKAPRMLASKEAPLFLRWAYFPKLAPWLMKYLSHANDADTRRIARGLAPIVSDSVSQHMALTESLGLQDWITQDDYAYGYRSRADFDAERYTWDLRREAGFEPILIDGNDVRDYEPNISGVGFIAACRDHGFIRDPGGYVGVLAKRFEEMGGRIVQASVQDVDLNAAKVQAVLTDRGTFACDCVVLATGVWSKPLMQKLGLRVPLESERGYHIVYEGAEHGPKRPIMITSGKFVATPMAAGVRCAGLLEFGGLDAGPSRAPFQLLRRKTREAFPNMTFTREIEWMGHRPAPADSLPLIGQIGQSGVYTAFGHHHIGLTGGPKTGRLVAGLIAGQPTNMDLSAYAPERFAK